MILVLETSGANCGAAIWDQNLITHSYLQDSLRHNEVLIDQIALLLSEAHVSITQVAAVGVSAGPGSFTGLRVGMAVAKGICWSRKIPLITVPTLEAIAACLPITDASVVAIMPARAGEVFWAQYTVSSGQMHLVSSERLTEIKSLASQLSGETFLHGEGYFKYQAEFEVTFGGRLLNLPPDEIPVPQVLSVARIAGKKFNDRLFDDIMKTEPLYYFDFPRGTT
jgi:tRNA threonylcarbamoyladenosine biosynthesis protein TsaB